MGAVNWEAEDELGRRTKQSEASYWLILVNYPPVMKSRSRNWQTGGRGGGGERFSKEPWPGSALMAHGNLALRSLRQASRDGLHTCSLTRCHAMDGPNGKKSSCGAGFLADEHVFFQKAIRIKSDNTHGRMSTAPRGRKRECQKADGKSEKAGRQKTRVRA